jgi:hypothetical protein
LAERLVSVDETSSRLSGQYRGQLERLRTTLAALRSDDRDLTDAKFRGLTELVNDVSSGIASGQTARLLDLFTVFLIAAAPDFLSLIVALLARTLRTHEPELPAPPVLAPMPVPEAASREGWFKQLKRSYGGGATNKAAEVESLNALVKAHFRATQKAGLPEAEPPPPASPAASKVTANEAESIYEQLEKMEVPTPFRRRPPRPND